MKVLWITNIVFPEALKLIGTNSKSHAGGWMISSANDLASADNVELTIASISSAVKELTFVKGLKLSYVLLPYGKGNLTYNKEYERYWIKIKGQYNPDVVHIHGTEFTQGLSYVKACGADNVVVSIQGLLHVIKDYSTCSISTKEILCNYTLRDLLFKTSLISEKRDFEKRSRYELELLKSVNHIIGRTSWDKAHVWAVNHKATYYKCNESLRSVFYEGKWEYASCKKHSIFLSQGSSALKGAHQVLRALPLVLKHFPDTVVRIAGKNPSATKGRYGKLLITGYGRYMARLIKKCHIGDKVQYLGMLDENQMKQEYLNANIFICPSSIENSPNSLGEAQVLGVPCIGSYVGGVPDFIPTERCGMMYRFDDIEVLSYTINNFFRKSEVYDNQEPINLARLRHDKINNKQTLLNVYREILTSISK